MIAQASAPCLVIELILFPFCLHGIPTGTWSDHLHLGVHVVPWKRFGPWDPEQNLEATATKLFSKTHNVLDDDATAIFMHQGLQPSKRGPMAWRSHWPSRKQWHCLSHQQEKCGCFYHFCSTNDLLDSVEWKPSKAREWLIWNHLVFPILVIIWLIA